MDNETTRRNGAADLHDAIAAPPILLLVGPPADGVRVLFHALGTVGFDTGRGAQLNISADTLELETNPLIIAVHDKLLLELGVDLSTDTELPEGWLDSGPAEAALNHLEDALSVDFSDAKPALVADAALTLLLPLWQRLGERLDRPLAFLPVFEPPDLTARTLSEQHGLDHMTAMAISAARLRRAFGHVPNPHTNVFLLDDLAEGPAEAILGRIAAAVDADASGADPTALALLRRHAESHRPARFDWSGIHDMYGVLREKTLGQPNIATVREFLDRILELDDVANALAIHRAEPEAATPRRRRGASTASLRLTHRIELLIEELDTERRLKEAQDRIMEIETKRARMVETELNDRIRLLEAQLRHYTDTPLRSGLKLAIFNVLRAVRHGLPLPEAMKMRLAQRLTGVALALQSPRTQPRLELDQPVDHNTQIDFEFRTVDAPVISIIVPMFNNVGHTIACLRSIYQQKIDVDYEVILADDASTDEFHTVLKTVPGLRYVRNAENLHFLRNCNRNAEHARGDYLVFLNNDTLVKPGWLQALYNTFIEHIDVGVVGSKLVFPNGDLQEAGGIIWEDGSGWNWGRGQNPDHPLYNFVRDADYVSGASIMVPAELWRDMGGFDERYEKAYYEDTDLCFRMRERGYRVLYQPLSEVVHVEGLSSGTDLESGVKRYQTSNQAIFMERWRDTLASHLPNATTPLVASDRMPRGHVLYIDAVTPEPDKDSGSLDAVNAMRILISEGYRVHFVPGSNFAYWGDATRELQKMGVECVYHPFYSDLNAFIDERGDMFDLVVLSRPESAADYLDTVRKRLPSAKIVYNTVDLHFMRMEREAKLTGDADRKLAAAAMKAQEKSYIDRTDATIVLSSVEHDLLSRSAKRAAKLWTIPLIRPETTRLVDYGTTRDIAFIGGYRHPPNVDAVEWLAETVWPAMRERLPGVRLHICGSAMPDRFHDYACEDIVVRGFVPDLDALLSGLRLTVAPLRFGAGLKGKVAASIGVGVPCIGTPVAFEGMAEDGLDAIRFAAATPQEFAKLAEALYFDEAAWTAASKAGVAYHNANYGFTEVRKTYARMIDSLTAGPRLADAAE